MHIIKCPKCRSALEINITSAIDEDGEVFICSHCNYHFRYAPNG